MNVIQQHAYIFGVALLAASILFLLMGHDKTAKLIAAPGFALLALDNRKLASRHPEESGIHRCYSASSALINIGAVTSVMAALVPGTLPPQTEHVTLLAGAGAAGLARLMDQKKYEP